MKKILIAKFQRYAFGPASYEFLQHLLNDKDQVFERILLQGIFQQSASPLRNQ